MECEFSHNFCLSFRPLHTNWSSSVLNYDTKWINWKKEEEVDWHKHYRYIWRLCNSKKWIEIIFQNWLLYMSSVYFEMDETCPISISLSISISISVKVSIVVLSSTSIDGRTEKARSDFRLCHFIFIFKSSLIIAPSTRKIYNKNNNCAHLDFRNLS